MTNAASSPAQIARSAIEIVCSGQLDRAEDFYDPGFVDYVNGMVFHGPQGARESVGFYRTLFTGLRFEVVEQITEAQRVATRWTLHGSYRGRQVELEGISISTIVNGKIVEDHGATDSLALPRALGPRRTLGLLVDLARGRVSLPKGALTN